jgi:hypothetical protein
MTKESTTPETIIIPIYYYIDEDDTKVYDIEEMTKEFELALYQLERR